MSRNLNPLADENLYAKKYSGSWVRLWVKKNGKWQVGENPIQENSEWDKDGVNYQFRVPRKLQALQIGGENISWKFIMIPPDEYLNCLIRPVKDKSDTVHPLEVIITSENYKAETLLNFLQTGDMDRARSLMHSYAKELLNSKLKSPTSAAIAGYYLLKVKSEQWMHDWVRNLTNWME